MTTASSDELRRGEALFASALQAQAAGRLADSVRLLAQATQAGHLEATAQLGRQVLFGRGVPQDARKGLQLVFRAAELGNASGCILTATLLASGVLGPADVPRALTYLQRAAEAGHAGAQAQLRLLADPSGGEAAGSWDALRRRIDLAAWRRGPELQSVRADPDIRAVEGFLSPSVCAWLIAGAKDRLKPAEVMANEAFREERQDVRSNSHAGYDLEASDLVLILARERLAAAAGVEVAAMEAPQVLHYAPGESYGDHFDFMDPEKAGHIEYLARLGQRALTLLVYLNDDFEGGETDFPLLELKHRGRTGGLLLFRNADAAGRPDRRMLHAGRAPTSGEKWLLSQWVRDRAQPT
jgi:hypothetical protein